MTYLPFDQSHTGSRKRGWDHINSNSQRPGSSLKAARTNLSSKTLGLMVSHGPSIRRSDAYSPVPSFHMPVSFRVHPGLAGSGYGPYPSSVQYQPGELSPCSNDSYMSDAMEAKQNQLLNEHYPYIVSRPFSRHQPTHLASPHAMQPPDSHDFLSLEQFCAMADEYVQGLSERKRDKALLSSKRCANIRKVLKDPKATTVETAQFRFWAKKMFRHKVVTPYDTGEPFDLVTHESKPVACKEDIYQILVDCHRLCAHGGRDKTSAQVRKLWSWIPKELIARFVANCPKCEIRRNVKNNALSRQRSSPDSASPASIVENAPAHLAVGNSSAAESVVYHHPASAPVSANGTTASANHTLPQFIPHGFQFAPSLFAGGSYPVVSQDQYLGNGHFQPSNPFGGYH